VSAAAHAAGVGAVLKKAQELTVSGQPDQAVEALREVQVDHPDAVELKYALGEALYAAGTARAEADPAAARELYAEAERMFGAADRPRIPHGSPGRRLPGPPRWPGPPWRFPPKRNSIGGRRGPAGGHRGV
jgi:hypothetical protein